MFEILRKIGLTESEIKVFQALSKVGSAPVSDLVQKTHLHRTNLYDILERLREKGIISSITKNNVKYFSILEPKNLLNLLEKQKKELTSTETEILELIKNIKPSSLSPEKKGC